jgi:hypothetical protein
LLVLLLLLSQELLFLQVPLLFLRVLLPSLLLP